MHTLRIVHRIATVGKARVTAGRHDYTELSCLNSGRRCLAWSTVFKI